MTVIKKITYIFCAIFCFGVVFADTHPRFEMQDLESILREDGSEIYYDLRKTQDGSQIQKSAQKPRVLLVLIQGSGCLPISQQSQTMRLLATVMPESDQLWVEKRGLESVLLEAPDEQIHLENCPLDYYTYESLSQRVQDYTEVITALSKEYDEIILLGGSEGATIVGLLRQRSLPITAAIALNGGGQYFFDDILWSISQTVPDPEKSILLAEITGFIKMMQAISDDELEQFTDYSSNHSARWWREMLNLDMADVWKQSDISLLMIQTLGDNNVSVPAAKLMFEDLSDYAHIQVTTYSELDHGFKDADGNSHIVTVTTDIQKWLHQVLNK